MINGILFVVFISPNNHENRREKIGISKKLNTMQISMYKINGGKINSRLLAISN